MTTQNNQKANGTKPETQKHHPLKKLIRRIPWWLVPLPVSAFITISCTVEGCKAGFEFFF